MKQSVIRYYLAFIKLKLNVFKVMLKKKETAVGLDENDGYMHKIKFFFILQN
jgi:hypothetical protein